MDDGGLAEAELDGGAGGAVAICLFLVSVGLSVMPRCRRVANACQAGAARALAASHKRRAARPHSSAAGEADAMAILMRRTETRTSAPIFSSLRRMLPQVESAKMVSARPMRRKAQTST